LEKSMNVLILISHFGTYGGTHRVAFNLANRMAQDYKVTLAAVYGDRDQSYFSLDDRVLTTVFLPQEERLRTMALKLRKPFARYLREREIDVVLLIGNYQAFLALPTMLTYKKPRYMFCDHGALMNQWHERSLRLIHRFGSWFSDATVVLTQQSRQDYLAHLHSRPEKIHVIPNWIEPRLIEHPDHYNSKAHVVLWAGRLDKEKGVEYLLEIARRVLPQRPQWKWLVFGTGEKQAFLQEGIEQSGLGEQLILGGYVETLYEKYADCGICTLTSEREGLPLVLLEAKACGIPLISFDVVTGPREIIRDGIDGFLVAPFDVDDYACKLMQLMDNPQLRIDMSRRSHETLERFSADAVYAQWCALIEELGA
jgi:glycosyltransferase involved in cell wall biosynthesis